MQDQKPGKSTSDRGYHHPDDDDFEDWWEGDGEQLELFPDADSVDEIVCNVLYRMGYDLK